MPSLLWTYFVVLAVLLVVDGFYLYFVAGPLFQTQVLAVQRTSLDIDRSAALLCYFVIAAILVYLSFLNRHKYAATEQDAFFLGVGIYAVFELTCKAIFSQWTWQTVVIDSLWGGVLFATVLYVSKLLLRKTSFP